MVKCASFVLTKRFKLLSLKTIVGYMYTNFCKSIAFWDVTDILYCKLTSFLRLMPLYAFAIGNVRMYLRIGPKTRTNRRFSKTRPDARTAGQGQKRGCVRPTYLPENQYQHYHLRQRPHNKAIVPKTTYLSDRDYIMRMLYKNCHTLLQYCYHSVCLSLLF